VGCDEAVELGMGVATWPAATISRCSNDMDDCAALLIETVYTALEIPLGRNCFRLSPEFNSASTDLLWLCSDARIAFDVTRQYWK
jgi:hypothetical protein